MKYKVYTRFENYGYQVVEADSPKEAYETAKRNTENKVLPDLDLCNKGDPHYYVSEFDAPVWSLDMQDAWSASGAPWPGDFGYDDSIYDDPKNFDGAHYIWGLKSYDDLTPGDEPNFFTMNDIDVWFDDYDKKYHLAFEELLQFERSDGIILHLRSLADAYRRFLSTEYKYSDKELDDVSKCSALAFYPTTTVDNLSDLTSSDPLDLYHKFELFIAAYTAVHKLKREGVYHVS